MFLKIELNRMAKEYGVISNIRGYGTHLAFDCEPSNTAPLSKWFKQSGINI